MTNGEELPPPEPPEDLQPKEEIQATTGHIEANVQAKTNQAAAGDPSTPPGTSEVPPATISLEDKKLQERLQQYVKEYDGLFTPASFPDATAAVTNNLFFAIYCEIRKMREILEKESQEASK